MSVCVVGTSNSIMKNGWYDGLRSTYPGSVCRFSLGGAPFTQLARFIDSIIDGEYDYIVVDTTPNDESFSSKIGHISFFENLYDEFISILSKRARTIVLQLPTQTCFRKENHIRDFQRQVISKHQGYYVPIDRILSDKYDLVPATSKVHADNFHLDMRIAWEIGAAIGEILPSLPKSERKDATSPFSLYYGKSSSSQQTTVKTSLIECHFRVLELKDRIDFDDDVFCLGFFFNSAECRSALRLHAKDGRNRHIISFYENEAGKQTVRFHPIQHGLRMNGLSVVHHGEVFDLGFQSSLRFNPPFKSSIEAFLIYSGDPKRKYTAPEVHNEDGDLSDAFLSARRARLEGAIDSVLGRRATMTAMV